MSLKEDKAYEEAKNFEPPKPPEQFDLWKATRKYVYVGVACFVFGLSVAGCYAHSLKMSNKSLFDENRELKKTIKTIEKTPAETVLVPYTVLVPVTEAVEPVKDTAPVTDAPVKETTAQIETDAPVKETAAQNKTESPKDNEYQIRVLTNPLTKEAQAPRQIKKADDWKDYWISVKRSDLYGMKPDDLKFFYEYINEKCEIDGYFYVLVTDIPGLCFQFNVTDNEYILSSGEFFAGIDQNKSNRYSPYLDIGSCAIRVNDPEQFEIQGLCKDEYGLERFDDDKIYHYSEFNDDMFAKLDELQEDAKKLWG